MNLAKHTNIQTINAENIMKISKTIAKMIHGNEGRIGRIGMKKDEEE